MNDQLRTHLEQVFAPYSDMKPVAELKEELQTDLEEKYEELRSAGHDEEAALQLTIASLGDVAELLEGMSRNSNAIRQVVGIDVSSTNLVNSDLRGVAVHDGKFDYANLKGSDFSGADLANSSFKRSNLVGAKFDGANLSGATVRGSNLERASFVGATLDGTDFTHSNLSGVCFDNQHLRGTVFNGTALRNASFRNAVFENVMFKTDAKKIAFDGATMDKLTFAVLKGMGAKLDGVSIV